MARLNSTSNLSLTDTASPWDEPRLKQTRHIDHQKHFPPSLSWLALWAKRNKELTRACPGALIFRSRKRKTGPCPSSNRQQGTWPPYVGTSTHGQPDVLLGVQNPSLLQLLQHPDVLGTQPRPRRAVLRCQGPWRRQARAVRDAGRRAPRGQSALHGLLRRLRTTGLSGYTPAALGGWRECQETGSVVAPMVAAYRWVETMAQLLGAPILKQAARVR